jgi:hypothetical protein
MSTETSTVPVTEAPKVKKIKVAKKPAAEPSTEAPVETKPKASKKSSKPAAEASAEAVPTEPRSAKSKTTTKNIDEMLRRIIGLGKISEKEVRETLAHLLPTTSEFKKNPRRRTRNPGEPARTLSPYLCFNKEQRPIVKAQDPSLTFVSLTQTLAKMWGALADRSKYEEMSRADGERYARELAEYQKTHPVPAPAEPKKTRKSKKAVESAEAPAAVEVPAM